MLGRRIFALVIGLLILFGLVTAVRGCLGAREERAYENYLSDLSSVAATSSQLSKEFFGLLSNPGEASATEFGDQIGATRGTGTDLLNRIEGLDAPNDAGEAQSDLKLAYELRRDALGEIANRIDGALQGEDRPASIEAVATAMRSLLASDVLYARARADLRQILADKEIDGQVPESVFLPEPVEQWVDFLRLSGQLARVAGATGVAGSGTHGTELASTVVKPGNVTLAPEAPTTVSGSNPQLFISVLNGGTEDETDVFVSYRLTGGLSTLDGRTTISRIAPGATEVATMPIEGEIPRGEQLVLTVTVLPVAGEELSDNNESTYPVTFE